MSLVKQPSGRHFCRAEHWAAGREVDRSKALGDLCLTRANAVKAMVVANVSAGVDHRCRCDAGAGTSRLNTEFLGLQRGSGRP